MGTLIYNPQIQDWKLANSTPINTSVPVWLDFKILNILEIYYIKLKSCLCACLSVCTFWHADNSAVSAWIETGLAQNESCVFEDLKVCF